MKKTVDCLECENHFQIGIKIFCNLTKKRMRFYQPKHPHDDNYGCKTKCENFKNNNMDNTKKYGSKENDIISIQYEMSKEYFTGFIFGNIQKYLKRYFSEDTEKSGNDKDIVKVLDYVNRYEEVYSDVNFTRLKELIETKDYKTAFIHSIDLQENLL